MRNDFYYTKMCINFIKIKWSLIKVHFVQYISQLCKICICIIECTVYVVLKNDNFNLSFENYISFFNMNNYLLEEV